MLSANSIEINCLSLNALHVRRNYA